MKQPNRSERRNEILAINKEQPRMIHKYGRLIGLIVIIVLFVIGAYVLRLYGQTRKAINSTYEATGNEQAAAIFKQKKPFAMLLLGADTGAEGRNDQGNSDTMIVVTVNPKKKQVRLISVPRDTMAQIQGTKNFKVAKINSAYMYGGSKMALATVNELLDVHIDYYLTVNMGGLQKIVTALDGVDVDVPFDFSWNGSSFTKGLMHLNGKQALDYARMRYDDPEGDYGRQKRQRQVITAMIKSAVSTGTLANFQAILQAVTKNMKTNLTFDDMAQIFLNYRVAGETVKSDHLQGISAYVGKSDYQIASTSELQRVSTEVRTAIGLNATSLSNQETRQNRLNAANGFIFKNPTTTQTFSVFSPNSDYQYWSGN